MEDINLQRLKKRKMKPTRSESCGLAQGVAIEEVKSAKIDKTTREIVLFTLKRKVADKRNRSRLRKKGCASVNGSRRRRYEP